MRSMRERVERLGGTLDVQSAASCGTRLLAEVSIGDAAGSIVSG